MSKDDLNLDRRETPPPVIQLINHPVTGQPLGLPAVVVAIPDIIMNAISEMVRNVMREELQAFLTAQVVAATTPTAYKSLEERVQMVGGANSEPDKVPVGND